MWLIYNNSLTPTSNQDRISPNNIHTITRRQVMRIKKNINKGDYQLVQYQILHTNKADCNCNFKAEIWENTCKRSFPHPRVHLSPISRHSDQDLPPCVCQHSLLKNTIQNNKGGKFLKKLCVVLCQGESITG